MKRRFAVIAFALLGVSCQREQRGLDVQPAVRHVPGNDTAADKTPRLLPGGPVSGAVNWRPPGSSPFHGNAYAISQGQQLFGWYNCTGCHGHGGGGIGPALNDNIWTYGSSPKDIFESIAKGRKNGMPAWGGRIPEYQIWQLVAYVRSMTGQQPRAATSARTDELETDTTSILEKGRDR